MTDDPWHFGRDELATQTLSLLSSGPAQALTLFAPRRTGKTEFLLKDLAPHAESEGHRVIYGSIRVSQSLFSSFAPCRQWLTSPSWHPHS